MSTPKTQNERLAVVENNILHIGQTVTDIKLMVKEQLDNQKNFITKAEADMCYADKQTEKDFKSAKGSIKWVTRLAIITLFGIIGFLIQQYFVK